jgi:hypothetical protein
MKQEMPCVTCGKVFTSSRKDNITCSSGCSRKRWIKNLTPEQLERHRAKCRAGGARWQEKHKPNRKAYHAEYLNKNRERYRILAQRWRDANREHVRALGRKRYKKNRGERLSSIHIRRARLRNNPKPSKAEAASINNWWDRAKSRTKNTCYWCLSVVSEIQLDHIVSIASGGGHTVDNLCISCANCNQRKASKPLSEWASKIQSPTLSL